MRPRRPAPIIIRMDATAIRGLTMRLLPLLPVAGDGVAAGVTGAGAGRVGAAAGFSMTVASSVMAASSVTAASSGMAASPMTAASSATAAPFMMAASYIAALEVPVLPTAVLGVWA